MSPLDARASEPEASFDYLYIVANEEGSSGGHAALRLGHFVYHFQNEAGLLVLKRDRSDDFFFDYALLENRAIHASRIEVSPDVLSAIQETFRERYLVQSAHLARLRSLERDRRLLERLARPDESAGPSRPAVSFAVPGLGYFAISDSRTRERSASLVAVRDEISRRWGADFLEDQRRSLHRELQWLDRLDPIARDAALPESVYDYPAFSQPFSERFMNAVAGLAAVEVLERASPLAAENLRSTTRGSGLALGPRESRALARFARTLERQVLDLFGHRREDWGSTALVAMARLESLHRSISLGRLAFLDSFPDAGSPHLREIETRESSRADVEAENRRELDASWAYFLSRSDPGELAWERFEERGNRYLEISRAAVHGGRIRVAEGHLVPARTRPLAVRVSRSAEASRDRDRIAAARRRERDYARRLERLYRYELISRNCVTALFETLNESLGGSVERVEEGLGGHVGGRGSLFFIPFVSARQVNDRFRIAARERIPSYREQRLLEMSEEGNRFWLAIRESNTLSARSYRIRAEDSFFIFFTDRAPVLRPLFGAVNLVAGVGQSLFGLIATPIDRGRNFTRGLRGTFVSLPELVFWNIRKGSYSWIPHEHRRIEPVVITSESAPVP